MKTKELIKRLQEADPSGEHECCVGNVDIVDVMALPAYYDGPLQVLVKDDDGYIVGARYDRGSTKISIFPKEISDLVFDSVNRDGSEIPFTVDYSELSPRDAEATKERHESIRQWCKNLMARMEVDLFVEWAKKKVQDIALGADFNATEFRDSMFEFAKKNISPADSLVGRTGMSYRDERFEQWDNRFEIVFDELGEAFVKETVR